MQFADLLLLRPEGGGRNHFFLGRGRGQRSLLGKTPPGEKLVRRHAASASDEADRDARLARLRRTAGLTLAEIATRLGVSKPTVWAWEQGKSRPAESRIDALAEALGVTRADLLPGPGVGALQELLARSRNQIARTVGVGADKVRIMIEL